MNLIGLNCSFKNTNRVNMIKDSTVISYTNNLQCKIFYLGSFYFVLPHSDDLGFFEKLHCIVNEKSFYLYRVEIKVIITFKNMSTNA